MKMTTRKGRKWMWKMNYCKKNRIPPGEVWAWELAEIRYLELMDKYDIPTNTPQEGE